MERTEIIENTEDYIRIYFQKESSGHDWWHIHRVRQMSLLLAKSTTADLFLIEMAALLHDLDDWKLQGKAQHNRNKVQSWLKKIQLNETTSQQIISIIDEISFKGAEVETKATSIESQIVQDADRLDAIGAIGIARTFSYGGNKGRLIYDPSIIPEKHQTFEAYKKGNTPTINHFYEKLLLLKDRLNTREAKRIAEERHQFMLNFLDQFYLEWNCFS